MASKNYEEQQQYPQMGQNPSMYRARGLSPEEESLLKRLRLESSWKAGYPFALITGGTLAILTKNKSTAVRVGSAISGLIVANIVGKLSYIPTIRQRILDDLPETSELRQRVVAMSGGSALSTLGNFENQQTNQEDHQVEFSTGEEYDMRNLEPDTEEKAKPKKYITYEELRRRNQEKRQNKDDFSSVSPLDTKEVTSFTDVKQFDVNVEESSPSGSKVRYNKYGDRILE